MAKNIGMATETKSIPSVILADDGQENSRLIKQIFSVAGVKDGHGDIIRHGAFKKTLKERKDRIQILWMHNFFDPPVGALRDAYEIDKATLPPELTKKFPEATGALVGEVEYLNTPRGEEILVGIKMGAIRENSIGFDPVKVEYLDDEEGGEKIRNLIEIRLWDLSPVTWGSNPATMNIKGAIPFKSSGTDPKEASWSKPLLASFTNESWDELEDAEKIRIAAHFAWAGDMPPESFGECRMPHHTPKLSGLGPTNWGGVQMAMKSLLQAATDVPDRFSVYNHLAKHYRDDFNETPIDFKMIEMAYAVKDAISVGQEAGEVFEAMTRLFSLIKAESVKGVQNIPIDSLTLKGKLESLRLAQHIYSLEG